MSFNILFIGDIVGSAGRKMLELSLPKIIDNYHIDFVIANGENVCGGTGINKQTYQELVAVGIDAITMGNHTWHNRDIFNFIDQENIIIRPANFPTGTPGVGYKIFACGDKKIAVINLMGRTYMEPIECPFNVANEILKEIKEITPFIFVDIHAEATSEKMALAWYLDGRVSAVVGTHTHVQTNDCRLLTRGTAFMTDAGMTGPRDSVLGVDKDDIIFKFTKKLPVRFKTANGDLQFNGAIVELDENGKGQNIFPVNLMQPSL